jgi:mRNA interferase MazF
VTPYCPEAGDIVWMSFEPHEGTEQVGHRPALVLSPAVVNSRTGRCSACPITGTVKPFPFVTVLPEGLEIGGAVLVDQLRGLDWKARRARFVCRAPDHTMREVRAKLKALLGIE